MEDNATEDDNRLDNLVNFIACKNIKKENKKNLKKSNRNHTKSLLTYNDML